ncbi:MAG: DUF1292 domain-containing protein [Clostridia bacterium]|nr:DUF1292 domain-containing protein [Clostridia bacterium]
MDDDSIITLTDDEGNEVDFLLLDVVEYDEKDYLVLLPMEDEETEEGAEEDVLILQAVRNGDEETYIGIEDETVLNAVFGLFTAQLEAAAEAAGLDDDEDSEEAEEE